MKTWLSVLARAYAAVTAYAVALLALLAVVLFATGALTPDRLKEAFAALRAPKARPVERKAPVPESEQEKARRTEATLDDRERSLDKLETRLVGEIAIVRQEREEVERARKKLVEDQTRMRKEQDALAEARSDAELAANVPILSRMDGSGIVAFMKGWDDARFVRYLRAMRPSKAAEVLEAVQSDPQFEAEFRRVPEEAPTGARTRAERLVEEFKKAP